MDPEATGFINFASYVFIRKVHLGWKKCALDEELSLKNVSCALYVVCPNRPVGLPEAKQAFDTAQVLDFGFKVAGNNYLSFR